MRRLTQLLFAATTTACLAVRGDSPPNLVLILADDLGIGDVSAYRTGELRTPNIDRLGDEGMLFTNMRANASVCSPTRAAILTGQYPDRVGVPGVVRTHKDDSWGWLDPNTPTLADQLNAADYHTALIGKWHLGLESPNTPNERGFDLFHGFLGDMMDSYTTLQRWGNNYMRRNNATIHPEGHATDLFSDWSINYLRERSTNKDQPFFLFLSYNAPHFPIEPPDEWLAKAKKREPQLDDKRVKNVAFVEHLDHGIGRVLTALKETGLEENTVVVFTSDNGGSLPHAQNNDPWRDGKQSHYDGGLRVPFIARWPGNIEPGSRSNYQGLTFDIFPTFMEIASGVTPVGLDAVGLVPEFRGSPVNSSRDLYFVRREGGTSYGGKSYQAFIRDEWKLLQNDPYSPLELYNLKDDPYEQNDLAGSNRQKFEELLFALQAQIQRSGSVPWQEPAGRRD